MIWLETPTNPLMKLVDIKAIAENLKSHPDIILVVDNTYLTCYFQVSCYIYYFQVKLRKIVFNH